MRSRLRKQLAAHFTREFESRFPELKRIDLKDGSVVWAWEFQPDLTFFVLLQPFKGEDQFAIETAWSDNREFPWGAFGSANVVEPRGRKRLTRSSDGGDGSFWDLAPEKTAGRRADVEALSRGESPAYLGDPPIEQALARVGPLVAEAVANFSEHGLPMFRRIAEHKGLSWPSSRA